MKQILVIILITSFYYLSPAQAQQLPLSGRIQEWISTHHELFQEVLSWQKHNLHYVV